MKTLLLNEAANNAQLTIDELINSLNQFNTIDELKKTWWINQYITPAYKNRKDLTIGQFKDVIIARCKKITAKKLALKKEEIENIFNSAEISEITVSIEWKKNRTWGANPTAEVKIFGEKFEYFSSGSISGCGYDKESEAFARALNQSLAFRRLLLENSDKIANDYGHRKGSLSGGVGVSCYFNIFENLGFTMKKTGSGKMFDCYHITKNK